jgi:hypothetical protein
MALVMRSFLGGAALASRWAKIPIRSTLFAWAATHAEIFPAVISLAAVREPA